MLIRKTIEFRRAFKNQVNFDHPHNNQINFIPTMKWSQIRSPTLKSGHFRPSTQKQIQVSSSSEKLVFFGQHTCNRPISTSHATKSISSLQLKPSRLRFLTLRSLTLKKYSFRPAHKNKVNFDPRTKTCQFRPSHQNHANFDPESKPSHFWPPHKTKSILILTPKQVKFDHTLTSIRVGPPTQQPSQFSCSS